MPPAQQQALRAAGAALTRRGFYLGGGTALAVHLGHRRSMVYALSYFDDAEQEPMPLMLWDVEWPTIRQTIEDWVRAGSW